MTNVYDGFGRLTRSLFDIGGIPRLLDHGYDASPPVNFTDPL